MSPSRGLSPEWFVTGWERTWVTPVGPVLVSLECLSFGADVIRPLMKLATFTLSASSALMGSPKLGVKTSGFKSRSGGSGFLFGVCSMSSAIATLPGSTLHVRRPQGLAGRRWEPPVPAWCAGRRPNLHSGRWADRARREGRSATYQRGNRRDRRAAPGAVAERADSRKPQASRR